MCPQLGPALGGGLAQKRGGSLARETFPGPSCSAHHQAGGDGEVATPRWAARSPYRPATVDNQHHHHRHRQSPWGCVPSLPYWPPRYGPGWLEVALGDGDQEAIGRNRPTTLEVTCRVASDPPI